MCGVRCVVWGDGALLQTSDPAIDAWEMEEKVKVKSMGRCV